MTFYRDKEHLPYYLTCRINCKSCALAYLFFKTLAEETNDNDLSIMRFGYNCTSG